MMQPKTYTAFAVDPCVQYNINLFATVLQCYINISSPKANMSNWTRWAWGQVCLQRALVQCGLTGLWAAAGVREPRYSRVLWSSSHTAAPTQAVVHFMAITRGWWRDSALLFELGLVTGKNKTVLLSGSDICVEPQGGGRKSAPPCDCNVKHHKATW